MQWSFHHLLCLILSASNSQPTGSPSSYQGGHLKDMVSFFHLWTSGQSYAFFWPCSGKNGRHFGPPAMSLISSLPLGSAISFCLLSWTLCIICLLCNAWVSAIYLCCYNRIPKIWWLIQRTNLFLIVQVAGKSMTKALVNLVSGDSRFCGSQVMNSCNIFKWWKGQGISVGLFYKGNNTIHKDSALMT